MDKLIVLGNARMGDALTMWPHFVADGLRHVAICTEYNVGVIDVFRQLTTLQVDEVRVIVEAAAQSPFDNEDWYWAWVAQYLPWLPREQGTWFKASDQRLEVMPVSHRHRHEGFIVLQLGSQAPASSFKRCDMLRRVPWPLPVKTFVTCPADDFIGEPLTLSLVDVARTMLRANCFVGTSSALALLAGQLGVPTLQCGWSYPKGTLYTGGGTRCAGEHATLSFPSWPPNVTLLTLVDPSVPYAPHAPIREPTVEEVLAAVAPYC